MSIEKKDKMRKEKRKQEWGQLEEPTKLYLYEKV